MFTKAYIGDYEVLAMAPLAVSHKYQNQKLALFLLTIAMILLKSMVILIQSF